MGGSLSPASAASTKPAAAPGSIIATPIALPSGAYLSNVGHVFQTLNNCGPASLIAVLQHYGLSAPSQADLGRALKPGKYMTTDVIAPYLKQYGLSAPIFRSGHLSNIKPFIASGIPVIILQYLNGPGSVPHFRVVRGYDDKTQRVYLSDSMYGANVYLTYTEFNALWKVYDNQFIPVYPSTLDSLLPSLVRGTAYQTSTA